MPVRKTPLITGQYYHVFNRGINHQPTFTTKADYQKAINTLNFYQLSKPPLKLSYFLNKSQKDQQEIYKQIEASPKRISLLTFCFMPNHFHLLLKQEEDNGISRYLADFQNSYTKYFNAKHQRQGSLLNRQFKAVHIETREQLLHVSRYIILNPCSNHLIKKLSDTLSYPYSFTNYLQIKQILDLNKQKYDQFVLDNANYQRKLEKIKHLLLEQHEFE